ncbi:Rne/Rng family ribonuclease [Leucobacter sp. GX24907]
MVNEENTYEAEESQTEQRSSERSAPDTGGGAEQEVASDAASEGQADVVTSSPAEEGVVAEAAEVGGTAEAGGIAEATGTGEATGAAEAEASGTALLPRLEDLSPEERFRATTRLVFLAPDVPPVPPRPRRSELRQLDEMLDGRFGDDERAEHDDLQDRDGSSRRRRRRSTGEGRDEPPQRAQPRQAPVITEPQKVKGSTRLEAKKQRRRDGRDAGRRRVVITESEFLARREAVDREMIVRTTADRIQIGVMEDKVLVEHYVARSSETSLIGNVYLGRVQNVLPSMEAAFVDIGRGRNAVLYSGEVDWSEFEGGNTARKIENALKPGDQVLVQVTKDPVGHKGARLTSQISLPGRFLVYVPGGAMNGISRKLPDTERARLKKILKEVLPSGAGVIVRTAAEGASEDQLTHDVQRLTRQWESIQSRVEKGGAPLLLHSEPDMLIKIVRDVFNEDFHKMIIAGDTTYRTIEDYLTQVAPDLLQRVERYEGERDVFDEYRISEQIAKALDRKVWLPSGGSLVIDRTEAMTVVDVNTGKFVGSGGNLEETVTKNNLEAAEEIVRQLRLRDIGGIIVVDFIDMVLESNRDLVLRRMVECLSRDRTKHQVAEVTSLGLVQMTRKKLGLGLLESFSEPCEVCAGRGLIVHHEPVAKHGGSGNSRGTGGKRGKGHQPQQSGGSRQNGGAQQTSAPQTHAITDGAKNMLAQVAASTIAGKSASDPEEGSAKAEGNLLDSVLSALPEAPPAGTGRARSRRVSTAPLRGGREATPVRDAEEAQLALDSALDATARAKSRPTQ